MFASSDTQTLSGISALVVEPEDADRAFLVSTLTSAGLRVSAADSFATARARLLRQPPTLLMTEIRLGFHNGLHLAHLARWKRPQMLLVVTSSYRDPVLIRDAAALGASFVPKPMTAEALIGMLCHAYDERRTLDQANVKRSQSLRWPRPLG